MRRNLTRRNRQSGQAILLGVVAIGLVLAGGLGLAIDSSQLYFHRQMAQAAADAAATAGILTMFQGTNSGTGSFSTSGTFTCGTNVVMIPCKYANSHGFGGTNADDTITVSFPTSAPGYAGTLSSDDNPNQIHVLIARNVSNSFIRLFGAAATTTIKAAATAGIVTVTAPTPIVLTHPSYPALEVNGTDRLTICGGPSRSIQINSSASNVFYFPGQPTIDLSHAGPADAGDCLAGTGADIGVFGGPINKPAEVLVGSTGHYIQPASPIQDPLAFVSPPPIPAPALATTSVAQNTHGCVAAGGCTKFTPGLYTSGIEIKNFHAIFAPGVYYIQSDKGFTIKNGSARMCSDCGTDPDTGSGMLIYDTGSTSSPNATGGFTFDTGVDNTILVGAGMSATTGNVAPTAPYYGILFFESRTANTHNHTIGKGNGCFSLIGTMYMTNSLATMKADPTHYQKLSYNGNPCSGTSLQGYIITGVLALSGTSELKMNLYPAAFLKVRQVALVQ